MSNQVEQTLVLIKPDAIERGLVGEILQRFERAGLTIKALKAVHPNEKLASDHYGDVDVRHGPQVKKVMVDFLVSGPVVAFVLEGIGAVTVVRKIVGSTYPHEAMPGTIRGDLSHVSKDYANAHDIAVKNLIHASSSIEDAKREISLWMGKDDFLDYSPVHDYHTKR